MGRLANALAASYTTTFLLWGAIFNVVTTIHANDALHFHRGLQFTTEENPSPVGPIIDFNNMECMEYNTQTANVETRRCSQNSPNQQWYFTPKNEFKSTIRDDKCLDYHYINNNLYMYRCHNGNNQKWYMDEQSRIHTMRNKDSSCLNPDNTICGCMESGIRQTDYRGTIDETKEGIKCQRWDSQSPHSHTRTTENYPNKGIDGGHNFCRNPDNDRNGAWCYTTNPNVRRSYCNVPICSNKCIERDLGGGSDVSNLHISDCNGQNLQKFNVFSFRVNEPTWYHWDGSTYDSAKNYCQTRSARLCRLEEICLSNNEPYGGSKTGEDQWVPIADTYNEWVQVGTTGTADTCTGHTDALGSTPTWGTTADDKSFMDYVICCPQCGDGIVDPGEMCDDGNDDQFDGCHNDCTLPICGDGIKAADEECDDGNDNDRDQCRNDCTLPICGDGFVSTEGGEECDNGSNVGNIDCTSDCKVPPNRKICDNGLTPGDLVITAWNSDADGSAKPVVVMVITKELDAGVEFYLTDRPIICDEYNIQCGFLPLEETYNDGTVKFTAPEFIRKGKAIAYSKHRKPYSSKNVYFFEGNEQYSDSWTEVTWSGENNNGNQFHTYTVKPSKDSTTEKIKQGDNIVIYCLRDGTQPVFVSSVLFSDDARQGWTVPGGDLHNGAPVSAQSASKRSCAPPYGPKARFDPSSMTFTTEHSSNHFRLKRPEDCGLEAMQYAYDWSTNTENWIYTRGHAKHPVITNFNTTDGYPFMCEPPPDRRVNQAYEQAQQLAVEAAKKDQEQSIERSNMIIRMGQLKSKEFHAKNNEYRERRSKFLPDGVTPILGNESPQTAIIDPRVPKCFGDVLCKARDEFESSKIAEKREKEQISGSGENQKIKTEHPLGKDTGNGQRLGTF